MTTIITIINTIDCTAPTVLTKLIELVTNTIEIINNNDVPIRFIAVASIVPKYRLAISVPLPAQQPNSKKIGDNTP